MDDTDMTDVAYDIDIDVGPTTEPVAQQQPQQVVQVSSAAYRKSAQLSDRFPIAKQHNRDRR